MESTWEVGSEVLYKGEVNGCPFIDYGVIEKYRFPIEYQYRYWSDNHGTERINENYLTISYNLAESPEGTHLSVRQSNIRSPEMYDLMNSLDMGFFAGFFQKIY